MSMCNICGDIATYSPKHLQVICDRCAKGVGAKLKREDFDSLYWDGSEDVAPSIKREFYSDYLASRESFEEYKFKTTVSDPYADDMHLTRECEA